eukprot:1774522-Rhodomonas_salina.1
MNLLAGLVGPTSRCADLETVGVAQAQDTCILADHVVIRTLAVCLAGVRNTIRRAAFTQTPLASILQADVGPAVKIRQAKFFPAIPVLAFFVKAAIIAVLSASRKARVFSAPCGLPARLSFGTVRVGRTRVEIGVIKRDNCQEIERKNQERIDCRASQHLLGRSGAPDGGDGGRVPSLSYGVSYGQLELPSRN